MIFNEIHIDGFGIFNSFTIKNLKQGINIIVGNNEVGKSTLLKFLRYTLFGYPRFKDQRMYPVKGGNHGGRLKAILSSNKEVVFERTGGDQINFHYEGKNLQNQSQWFQLLGNATREIFENVYAFSLNELIGLESLSTSGVEDKIFSVGLGLGNISIGDVIVDIQNKVDHIYTPRGRNQQIPSILEEIQSKKTQIQEIQNNMPFYQELTKQIKQLEIEIDDIDNITKDKRIEKEKLDNFLKCYESFVSLMKIDEDLETLPKLQNYPDDGIEQLKKLENKGQGLDEKILELQDGNEEDQGIEDLKGEIDSISFNQELQKNTEKVEHLKANLELYKQTVKEKTETDRKINSLDKSIKQELKTINTKWIEQDIIDFSDDITRNDKINDFKEKLDKIENDKRDLNAQLKVLQTKESPINTTNVFILLSLVFILGAIPAFYYSLPVLGIIFVIIAICLYFGRRYVIKESSLGIIQQQLSNITAKENEVKNGYEEYLEKTLNIEKAISIESVLKIFDTIKQLKKDINERDELNIKQEEQRIPFINQFETDANSIVKILEIKTSTDNTETIVNYIISEFDAAKDQLQKKEDLQNALLAKQKELERTELKFEGNKQLLTQLFKSINAKDKEDFRRKYEFNNKVKALIERRKNVVVTIETVVGLNKANEVIDFLKTNEQQDLKDKVGQLKVEISEKSEALNMKNKELGEKKNEVNRLEGESTLAEIMTELESERQKLKNAYKDWITGKIALKLLTAVKEEYEKEKQPAVINNSNTYFSKITAGRYNRISVALEERDITIFNTRAASKKIVQLSRGTKEQLLISLRLGFIEEYEKKSEPLPLIVDEVLVNFDPERAKNTAIIFQKFAENRQMLIFTCHPSIIQYFDNSKINIKELNS